MEASVCTDTALFTYQPHTAKPQMIVNIFTLWRACTQERNPRYMYEYHGWKYTAKAIAAAMNALGCSGYTEGDKTYSTSDYTLNIACKIRVESTSNTVQTAAEVLETDSSRYSPPPPFSAATSSTSISGTPPLPPLLPPTRHQSSPPPPIGRQLLLFFSQQSSSSSFLFL